MPEGTCVFLQPQKLLLLCVELLLRDHAGVEQVLELLQLVGGACTGRSGFGGSCRHAVRDGRLQLLAVGQQVTLAETQELLKQCGMAQLYPKNRRDAIILYGLTNGMDLFAVNDRLFAENEETLY